MYKIVLDPGHGGKDYGTTSIKSKLREKDITLKIALYAMDFLRQQYEIRVRLTRENDVTVKLKERLKIAKRFKANMFISIHLNQSNGLGVESFIGLEASKINQELQQCLHNEINKLLVRKKLYMVGSHLRKINHEMLQKVSMSSVLFNHLCIDNDFKLLNDERFLKELGEAYAIGIGGFLGFETM
ncbi:N-acetylmuramoyl-L-alanine amidase [Priestia megaterium]|uniref:N-acetylmuramoyl-L-alanine amidase n=1 Tax=Priestia megaterium TaxID=1404 RepID=UPI0034E2D086